MLDIRNFLEFIYIIILVVVAVRDQREQKIDKRSSILILVLAVCDLFLSSDIFSGGSYLGCSHCVFSHACPYHGSPWCIRGR